MNKKEIAMLLTQITTHYPRSGIVEDELTVAAWLDILGDRSYAEARAALIIYVRTGNDFAPNAGQLYKIIWEHTNPPIDETKIWTKIRRAVRYASNYTESRMIDGERIRKSQAEWAFSALPDDIQAIVGEPWQLMAWQKMSDRDFENYEKTRFFNAYNEKRKKDMELEFLNRKNMNVLNSNISKTLMVEGNL